MRVRVPTGGELALRWEETLSDRSDDSVSRSLSLSQPLLKGAWPAIDSAPVRRARLEEQIGILAVRQAAADLVVSTAGAYRALIGAVRQVEIAERALRRAQDQLEATRALIRAGRVARREAVRFEAAIANRELSLAQVRNGLDAANLVLVGLLAFEGAVRVRPLASLTVEHREIAHAPLFEEALRRREDFRQARLRVEIAQIELAVARNALLPDVLLGLDVSRADAGPTDTQVRLGAAIPLNDRGPELAWVRARTALRQSERGLAELRASIGIAVQRAVNDATVGLRLTELARGARELAESNLAIEKRKFGEGLASSFAVAASEDELIRAEQAEVDAIVAYLEAITRLDRVSGRTLEHWNVRLEAVPP
ncbi:MAG: TolC family protein [Rhodospirillales bacterium]|nr:TolC family protein [Rhodospirillales bacterium]